MDFVGCAHEGEGQLLMKSPFFGSQEEDKAPQVCFVSRSFISNWQVFCSLIILCPGDLMCTVCALMSPCGWFLKTKHTYIGRNTISLENWNLKRLFLGKTTNPAAWIRIVVVLKRVHSVLSIILLIIPLMVLQLDKIWRLSIKWSQCLEKTNPKGISITHSNPWYWRSEGLCFNTLCCSDLEFVSSWEPSQTPACHTQSAMLTPS